MEKSELIKGIVLTLVAFVVIAIAGSWDYEVSLNERYYVIPDCVHEHITLILGDNATKSEIVEYYDLHRMECDSIEIENLY